jgi:hypothetical protein
MYRKILVPVMGLALAGMACATTTFYTNQATFNAATSGLTFQTISDLSQSQVTGTGLLDPATSVLFTDQFGNGSLNVIDAMTLKLSSTFAMEIQVPSTYTAYWFDIVPLSFGASVTESSGSPTSSNGFTTLSTPIFFGIVTDTAVSGLQLAGGTSGGVEISNFNVASAASSGGGGGGDSEAPDATTMLTIGTGLILLRALRRRTGLLPPGVEPSQLY